MKYEIPITPRDQCCSGRRNTPETKTITANNIEEATLTAIRQLGPGEFRFIREAEIDKYYRIWWNKHSYRIIPLKTPWGGKELNKAKTYKLPPGRR